MKTALAAALLAAVLIGPGPARAADACPADRPNARELRAAQENPR